MKQKIKKENPIPGFTFEDLENYMEDEVVNETASLLPLRNKDDIVDEFMATHSLLEIMNVLGRSKYNIIIRNPNKEYINYKLYVYYMAETNNLELLEFIPKDDSIKIKCNNCNAIIACKLSSLENLVCNYCDKSIITNEGDLESRNGGIIKGESVCDEEQDSVQSYAVDEKESLNKVTADIKEIRFDSFDKVLYEDKRIKPLFNIFLPEAVRNNKAVGHILLLGCDWETANHFIDMISYKARGVQINYAKLDRSTKETELATLLTNLSPNDILLYKGPELKLNEKTISLLKRAISNYCMDIEIGKGVGARIVTLDLPDFSFVVCVERETETIRCLKEDFDYIINLDYGSTKRELCRSIINEMFAQYGIDQDIEEYILDKLQGNVRLCKKLCQRIQDYMIVSSKENNGVTMALVNNVIEITGVSETN